MKIIAVLKKVFLKIENVEQTQITNTEEIKMETKNPYLTEFSGVMSDLEKLIADWEKMKVDFPGNTMKWKTLGTAGRINFIKEKFLKIFDKMTADIYRIPPPRPFIPDFNEIMRQESLSEAMFYALSQPPKEK